MSWLHRHMCLGCLTAPRMTVGKYRFFIGIPYSVTRNVMDRFMVIFCILEKGFLIPTGWLYLYSCEGQQLVKSGSLVALPGNWVSLWITKPPEILRDQKLHKFASQRVFRCLCQHFRLGCCFYERKHTLNVGRNQNLGFRFTHHPCPWMSTLVPMVWTMELRSFGVDFSCRIDWGVLLVDAFHI